MRLLLAEDEVELSNALKSVLEKNNFSVDVVYNGEDAVEYLKLNDYDGAILDVMMPKKDGFTVLAEVRSFQIDLPILMLTAKSEIKDRVEGLDLGADDYLTKPFAVPELLARVRTMTRRKSQGRTENLLVYKDIKLDTLNSELITPYGKMFLGNKEFQMFEMLIVNQNQYLSAERFFEKIWGFDNEADMSVVWVNISSLRKKIRKLKSDVEIKAKRNIGYRLEGKRWLKKWRGALHWQRYWQLVLFFW